MSISQLPSKHDILTINISDFPPFVFSEKSDIALQIAAHLRRVLRNHGRGCPASLRIPSAITLSGFYQRSILDVLDGLIELKNQHYEYVMNGLDSEIILHDPLCRSKNNKSTLTWSTLSEELLNPWNAIKQHTRNPLTDILPRKAV